MNVHKAKLSRRNFLLAAGAGGAAGAAAIVAHTVPRVPPAASRDDKKSTQGYQISAHIRNYYRTTKV